MKSSDYWKLAIACGIIALIISFSISPTQIPFDWKTHTDTTSDISFKYPQNFGTTYITQTKWPPKIEIKDQVFVCKDTAGAIPPTGQTQKLTVNKREYCVNIRNQGAAGSMYSEYSYTFPREDKTVLLTFTLRFVQCANYDELHQAECQNERDMFDPHSIVDLIAQSLEETARK